MDIHGPGRLTRKQTTSRPDTLWPEIWKDMSDASKRKEKQKWAIEKPKLDSARMLCGIYYIDPDDEEFKDIMKMRVESWKFRCQLQCLANFNVTGTGKPVVQLKNTRQNTLVLLKPMNAMRKRMEGSLHKNHDDHIAGKRMNC